MLGRSRNRGYHDADEHVGEQDFRYLRNDQSGSLVKFVLNSAQTVEKQTTFPNEYRVRYFKMVLKELESRGLGALNLDPVDSMDENSVKNREHEWLPFEQLSIPVKKVERPVDEESLALPISKTSIERGNYITIYCTSIPFSHVLITHPV